MSHYITYSIDLTEEAWLALLRHGYDPTRFRSGRYDEGPNP